VRCDRVTAYPEVIFPLLPSGQPTAQNRKDMAELELEMRFGLSTIMTLHLQPGAHVLRQTILSGILQPFGASP
jgi:hypothetical protein